MLDDREKELIKPASPRRALYDIMREHRQRLADVQARRDAARDRLFGRPAFIILPREE